MNILITGSTGMIGNELLQLCLQSDQVSKITTLVRKSISNNNNSKLDTVVIKGFKTYDNNTALFKNIDVVFFCIGVYTGQVPDAVFKEITVDYAVNCAKLLKEQSPNARFCLLSGAGADRTEKSRTSFAKYKGIAENQIVATNLEFYTFRPAYIYPVHPRKEPNMMYRISRSLYPIIKLFGKNASIKSTELAKAMFTVGINGADKEILENKEILDYV